MSRLRIAYAGTPDFAVPALKALIASQQQLELVLTQPDRKAGRGRKIHESPVKQAATSANVQIFQPYDINAEEALAYLKSFHLDIVVVAAYGQIFSQALLDLPRLGCINIHASLLPRWRGAAPIQQAILGADKKTGVTIMQMCRAMDAGDIWLQSECEIKPTDNAARLHDRLAALGGPALMRVLSLIEQGGRRPYPQPETRVTYCTKLKKSDGLIDWHESAELIERKIRAFYPWPVAYTSLHGRRLRITRAELNPRQSGAQPGLITDAGKAGIKVHTGRQGIIIHELIPQAGRRVSAADFANANQLPGQLLGT